MEEKVTNSVLTSGADMTMAQSEWELDVNVMEWFCQEWYSFSPDLLENGNIKKMVL
jgi:hypothetical protein